MLKRSVFSAILMLMLTQSGGSPAIALPQPGLCNGQSAQSRMLLVLTRNNCWRKLVNSPLDLYPNQQNDARSSYNPISARLDRFDERNRVQLAYVEAIKPGERPDDPVLSVQERHYPLQGAARPTDKVLLLREELITRCGRRDGRRIWRELRSRIGNEVDLVEYNVYHGSRRAQTADNRIEAFHIQFRREDGTCYRSNDSRLGGSYRQAFEFRELRTQSRRRLFVFLPFSVAAVAASNERYTSLVSRITASQRPSDGRFWVARFKSVVRPGTGNFITIKHLSSLPSPKFVTSRWRLERRGR